MNLFIAGIVLYAMSIVIIELLTYAYKNMNSPKRARIRKRLRKYTFVKTGGAGDSEILKNSVLSDIPFLDKLSPPRARCFKARSFDDSG